MSAPSSSPAAGPPLAAGDAPPRILSPLRAFLARKFPFWAQLAAMLLAGGLLQAYVGLTAPVGEDEGSYLAGAAAIAQGQVPMVNFPARDPGLMYYLAIGARLFGPNILVAHLQMVVLSVATALLLALLARRLLPREGNRVALLVAGLFLFVPYDVVNGYGLYLEPLASFLLTCMAFLVLREYEQRRGIFLVVGGFFLGLAFLTRQSAAIVGLPFLVYLLWTGPSWRARLREAFAYVLPAALVAGGFSLYLIRRTDWTWFWQEMVVPPTAGLRNTSLPVTLSLVPYSWMIGASLLLVPLVVLVVLARDWRRFPALPAVLALLATIGVVGALVAFPRLSSAEVGEIGAVGARGALFSGEVELDLLLLALWGCVLYVAFRWRSSRFPLPLPVTAVLGGWAILFVGTDFSLRDFGVAPYLYDASAPLAILVSVWLVSIYASAPVPTEAVPPRRAARRERPWLWPMAMVVLLVLTSAAGTVLIIGLTDPINESGYYGLPFTNFKSYNLAEVDQVAAWIDRNSPSNATVFSLDDLYLTQAGRASTPVLSIGSSPYFRYSFPSNQSPYPPDTVGLLPSAQQLLSLWNQTHLSLVVEGPRTSDMMSSQPLIGWYFHTRFHPVRSFGQSENGDVATILEVGAPPGLAPITWVANYTAIRSPDAAAYSSTTNLLFSGGNTSQELWTISPNDTITYRTLPGVVGVDQIATGGGYFWVQPGISGEVGVARIIGGAFNLIPTPFSEALDLVANPITGNVYLLSPSQAIVAELDPAGTVLWKETLKCTPTALTFLTSPDRLLVTCSGSPTATVFDPYTGATASTPLLAQGLVALAPVQGGVIGLDHSGGLILWNTSWWGIVTENLRANAEGPLVPMPTYTDLLALSPHGAYPNMVAYDESSLAQVGNFTSPLVPSALVFRGSSLQFFEASTKPIRLAIVQLPAPTTLSVRAPTRTLVEVNGQPLSTNTLFVWPGVYEFSVSAENYETGQQLIFVAPGETSAQAFVGLGGSFAALEAAQAAFLAEVGALAVVATLLLLCLVFPLVPTRARSPAAPSPAEPT